MSTTAITSTSTTSTSMKSFTINDQILTEEWPSAPYQSMKGKVRRSIHWGQRKLLLTEIQFFVNYWDAKVVPEPVVLYVGAAPGIHIDLLTQMFPKFTFHLYDPRDFAIQQSQTVKIYNQKFTNADAKQWSGRSDVFFVCDIRSVAPEYSNTDTKGDPNIELKRIEDGIKEDMTNQRTWVEIMNPVQAHLKFRLPYPYNWMTDTKFHYLKGYCFVQPWATLTSTETRLVPEKVNGAYVYTNYDIKDYESKMFHQNTINRETKLYVNPLTGKSETIDGNELTNDYDSALEATILNNYFIKFGRKSEENVVKLSRLITQSLSYTKTLGSLRSASTQTFTCKNFDTRTIQEAKDLKLDIDYSKIVVTPETHYSSLKPFQVDQVRNVLKSVIKQAPKIIIDGTAHVGVDTINFAIVYPESKIVAVELNASTYTCLVTNINNFNYASRIQHRNTSIITLLNTESFGNVDLLYLDPPWSDKDYKTRRLIDLYLDQNKIGDIIKDLLTRKMSKMIILKVPPKFNFQSLTMPYNRYGINSRKGGIAYYLCVFEV